MGQKGELTGPKSNFPHTPGSGRHTLRRSYCSTTSVAALVTITDTGLVDPSVAGTSAPRCRLEFCAIGSADPTSASNRSSRAARVLEEMCWSRHRRDRDNEVAAKTASGHREYAAEFPVTLRCPTPRLVRPSLLQFRPVIRRAARQAACSAAGSRHCAASCQCGSAASFRGRAATCSPASRRVRRALPLAKFDRLVEFQGPGHGWGGVLSNWLEYRQSARNFESNGPANAAGGHHPARAGLKQA
jgi:hypothetical protein